MPVAGKASWVERSDDAERRHWPCGIIGEPAQLPATRHALRLELSSGIGVRRCPMEASTQQCLSIQNAFNATCNGWAVSTVSISISWHTRNYWQPLIGGNKILCPYLCPFCVLFVSFAVRSGSISPTFPALSGIRPCGHLGS